MYIDEIKAAAIKFASCPSFEIKAFRSMANRYPDGKLAFWIKKRYEYIEKIKAESWILGPQWINSDCPDLTTINDFISVIDNSLTKTLQSTYLSHLTQKDKDKLAQNEIDTFFKLWLEYRAVDAIIKDLEKNDDSPVTYEKLFKDSKECERLTQIITEQACKGGVFIGFDEAKSASKINQIKIVYKLVSEKYFKDSRLKENNGLELVRQIFLKRFGWTGYRGKKQPNNPYCVDLKNFTKIDDSKHNQTAIKEIELILSQK